MTTARKRTEILARADRNIVLALAETLVEHPILLEKPPEKSSVMVPMTDPIHKTKFYIGEVLVCEAMVSLDGTRGHAILMGDDFEKVRAMAVLDVAYRANLPECAALDEKLDALFEEQQATLRLEAGLHHPSRVDFETLDEQ